MYTLAYATDGSVAVRADQVLLFGEVPTFAFKPTDSDKLALSCVFDDTSGVDKGPNAAFNARGPLDSPTPNACKLVLSGALTTQNDYFLTRGTTSSAFMYLAGPNVGVYTGAASGGRVSWTGHPHTFAMRIFLPSSVLQASMAAGKEINLLEFGFMGPFTRSNPSRIVVSSTGTFRHTITFGFDAIGSGWYREYALFPTDRWIHVVCAVRGNVWYDGVQTPLVVESGPFPTSGAGVYSSGYGYAICIGQGPINNQGSVRPTVAGVRMKEIQIFTKQLTSVAP